ncbi:MAG: hypothetical protein ACR2FL_06100 [Nocardioidaceae bacterium]
MLGGGGITGIAWELGLLTGLADAGPDLTDADLVVGTSAGSVVVPRSPGARRCASCTTGSWSRHRPSRPPEPARGFSPDWQWRCFVPAGTSRRSVGRSGHSRSSGPGQAGRRRWQPAWR